MICLLHHWFILLAMTIYGCFGLEEPLLQEIEKTNKVNICSGESQSLECSPPRFISILNVRSRTDKFNKVCKNDTAKVTSCEETTTLMSDVKKKCESKESCTISYPQCDSESDYLEIKFYCKTSEPVMSSLTTTTTTTSTSTTTSINNNECKSQWKRGVLWPPGSRGKFTKTSCPEEYEGNATWQCNQNGLWAGEPNFSECVSRSLVEYANDISNVGKSDQLSDELLEKLPQLVKESSSGGDVTKSIQIIRQIIFKITENGSQTTFPNFKVILNAADVLLDSEKLKHWNEMSERNNQLIALVQSVATPVNPPTSDQKTSLSNIDLKVVNAKDQISCIEETTAMKTFHLIAFSDGNKISYPSNSCTRSVTMTTIRNAWKILETGKDNLYSDIVTVASNEFQHEGQIFITIKLNRPVNYTVENVICFSSTNSSSELANQECSIIERNSSHVSCKCPLSSIFLLKDSLYHSTEQAVISPKDFFTLVVYVVCGFSSLCFLATFVLLFVSRKDKNLRYAIYQNFCICQVVSIIVFVSGVNQTDKKVLCTVIALSLHYILLVTPMWLLACAVHLYLGFTQLKIVQEPWFYVIAYTFPLLTLIISMASNFKGYGSPDYCWLQSENGFSWAFAGPALVIFWFSFALLCVIWKTAQKTLKSSTLKRESKILKIKSWTKSLALILFLTNMVWCAGLLYVYLAQSALAYLFSLFNCLLGVYVLVTAILEKRNKSRSGGRSCHSGASRSKSMDEIPS